MALQQVETNEGVGEAEDIDIWLQKNKLMKARQKLIANDVSLTELRELADESSIDELKVYAKSELCLDLITAKRFAKSVAELASTNISPKGSQNVSPKTVRVLITKEEQDILSNIAQRRETIKSKINKSLNDINTLKKVSTTNAAQVNQFRKDVIYQINQRLDKIIAESDKLIDKKKEIIGDHIQNLQHLDTSLNLADSKCNTFLDDTAMDINKRQNKIVDLGNDALKSRVEDIDITTKVTIKLDQNKMIEYINNMGDIDDHDVPTTPNLSIVDVQESSATVGIKNMKISWECSLEISKDYKGNNNDNDDDKKDDNEWKHLCSIRNDDKYRITTLDNDRNYGVRARYKDDKQRYGEWCQPMFFKTKPAKECFHINNSRTFKYISNQHRDRYHIFGTKRIERKSMNEYKWTVQTDSSFNGYLGIVDDTNNVSNGFKNGTVYQDHKDVVQVGASGCAGSKFGRSDNDMYNFIDKGDVTTINVNYGNDTICFESKKTNKKVVVKLKNGIQTVRLFAELCTRNTGTTMKLI